MKVLIVARMSPRLNSRTRRIIRILSSTYSVTVVSESLDKITPSTYDLDGAKLYEIPLPFYNKRFWYLTGLLRVLALNFKGIFFSIKENSDVIVCSDSIQILPGLVGKILLRRSFVYNSHEIMWALGNSARISNLLGWLERLAISFCDFWLVPSEERARLILDKHKLQKRYIVYENLPISSGSPNDRESYRTQLQKAGVPSKTFVVMFQGSITKQRGLEELIEAAECGFFHLVIQGQGNLLPTLQANASKHVTFLPPCSNDEVVSWLSAADVSFVFYENDCLNSAYACSNKFYSSIMAGTPVICNRLPAFEAFSKQHGGVTFINQLSTEAITECIYSIIDTKVYNSLREQILSARKILSNVSREQEIAQAFVDLQS